MKTVIVVVGGSIICALCVLAVGLWYRNRRSENLPVEEETLFV